MDYKTKLHGLLDVLLAQGASDLHLHVGLQPFIRVSGTLTPVLSEQPLTNEDILGLLSEMLLPGHKERFLKNQEIDFSWGYGTKGRFRGNGYIERGHYAAALRLIPTKIPTVAELGLPPILEQFAFQLDVESHR
jgi:twitching motility protein PilT